MRSQDTPEVFENGRRVVAGSALRVYAAAKKLSDDQAAEIADTAPWMRVVLEFEKFIDKDGTSVKDVADNLAVAFNGDSFPPSTAVDDRIAWQAVTRHLWNLSESPPADDEELESLEQSWGPWAERQAAQRPVVLASLA